MARLIPSESDAAVASRSQEVKESEEMLQIEQEALAHELENLREAEEELVTAREEVRHPEQETSEFKFLDEAQNES